MDKINNMLNKIMYKDKYSKNGITDTPRCNKGHICERNDKGIWDCPLCKEHMDAERREARDTRYNELRKKMGGI